MYYRKKHGPLGRQNVPAAVVTIRSALSAHFLAGASGHPSGNSLDSPFLTRRETAEYLRVSEKWLAQSGKSRGPKFFKFGALCRYRLDDVVSWARQQQVAI